MARLNIVRENPETRAREVTEYNIPECFASIADKKAQLIALNCIEALVDWVLTYVYSAYNAFYTLRVVMRDQARLRQDTGEVALHSFSDGTPFVDFTRDQVAGIRHTHGIAIPSRQQIPGPDFITLRAGNAARRVFFSRNPEQELIFSREAGTHYVAVFDGEDDIEGLFEIVEDDRPDANADYKEWSVNTAQTERLASIVGAIQLGPEEEIYIAEAISANAQEMLANAAND